MLISHLLHVDLIVFFMRADETHIYDPVRIIDLHNEPVVISFDIEHNPIPLYIQFNVSL